MELISGEQYETQVSLFIFVYGKPCGAFGIGAMAPAGSKVYYDHSEDGWNIFSTYDYIMEDGMECYLRIPDDYLEEQIVRSD